MGLPPEDESPRRTNYERNQMATDEIVRIIFFGLVYNMLTT